MKLEIADGRTFEATETTSPNEGEFAYTITGPRKFSLELRGYFSSPDDAIISVDAGNCNGAGVWCDRIRFEPMTHGDSWRIGSYMFSFKREPNAGFFQPNVTDNTRDLINRVIGALLGAIASEHEHEAAVSAQRSRVSSLEYKRDEALKAYNEAERALMTARRGLCELVGLE